MKKKLILVGSVVMIGVGISMLVINNSHKVDTTISYSTTESANETYGVEADVAKDAEIEQESVRSAPIESQTDIDKIINAATDADKITMIKEKDTLDIDATTIKSSDGETEVGSFTFTLDSVTVDTQQVLISYSIKNTSKAEIGCNDVVGIVCESNSYDDTIKKNMDIIGLNYTKDSGVKDKLGYYNLCTIDAGSTEQMITKFQVCVKKKKKKIPLYFIFSNGDVYQYNISTVQ